MTEPMGERGRQGAAPLGGHTPGPWEVTDGSNVWKGGDWIADCSGEANARLIAAAPDLLAACLYAERNLGRLDAKDVTTGQACWEVVHAAIAKARGEQ